MSEGPRPRIAVVGTGAISQVVHLPTLCRRDDVEVAAVADLDLHKANSVAHRYGVPVVLAPDEALDREDVDAVVIATPNDQHEALAIRAAEAGKHVFVERPVALTPEGVERVLAAAREAKTCLVVGLPHRCRPDLSALQAFVASGRLGEPYAVKVSWLTRRSSVVRTSWRHRRESGGGALMDLGVPALDLALWLVGYPAIRRVSCSIRSVDHEVEESATLMAESQDGIAFSVEVSSRYYAAEDRYFGRVMGTEGSGSVPPLEIYRQLGGRPMDMTPRQPRPREGDNPYTSAYRRLLDHFLRAVAGTADAPLPEEQVGLMHLVTAAYRAAEQGSEVQL